MTSEDFKFFERTLNNDLINLNSYIEEKYKEMKSENFGVIVPADRTYDPGNHWRTFNIFDFPNKEIHNIYKNVRDLTKEACDYYGFDFYKRKYYIHGWFNYWGNKVQKGNDPTKYDYHDHGDYSGAFHGYYSLSAEPSSTYYKINDEIFENVNKNNRVIVAKNGAPHSIGPWLQDYPRITIAYNICPINFLDPSVTHYIPLA